MASKKQCDNPTKTKCSDQKRESAKKKYNKKNYKNTSDVNSAAKEKSYLFHEKTVAELLHNIDKIDNTQDALKQKKSKSKTNIQFEIYHTKLPNSNIDSAEKEKSHLLHEKTIERLLDNLDKIDNTQSALKQKKAKAKTYIKKNNSKLPNSDIDPAAKEKSQLLHEKIITRPIDSVDKVNNTQGALKQKKSKAKINVHIAKSYANFPNSANFLSSNLIKPHEKQKLPIPHRCDNQQSNSNFRPSIYEENQFTSLQRFSMEHINRFHSPQMYFNQQDNRFSKSEICFEPTVFQNMDQTSNHFNKCVNVSNMTDFQNSIPPIKYKEEKNTNIKQINIHQKEETCNSKNAQKRRRRRKIKQELNEKDITNITPLLSFQRLEKESNERDITDIKPLLSFQKLDTEPEKSFDLIEFSDNEDSVPLSQDSVHNSTAVSFDLIDLSNDHEDSNFEIQKCNNFFDKNLSLIDLPVDNFDVSQFSVDGTIIQSSEDSSNESEVESEISIIRNSDIVGNINSLKQNINSNEAFVSVFWDIENCRLPTKKSVVDFANYVRQNFYDRRSEDEFVAACDVSKLSDTFVKELDEASITLMHINSLSKNAADKKIQSCLRRFQDRYNKTNSAVVLISSDSDFTQDLHDMRYKHHIFVNLICSINTKRCLKVKANKCELFDDIIQCLPDRSSNDNMQHILLVENLPLIKPSVIKKCLSRKLKSFNCRIRVKSDSSSAEIIFQDHSICNKALLFLKDYYLEGKPVSMVYQKRQNVMSVSTKLKNKTKSVISQTNGIHSSIKEFSIMNEELNMGKKVTLCVFVSIHVGVNEYWKMVFEETCKDSNFEFQWDGNILLVHFKSLRKAQKVKKLLQKNQLSDESAPKFIKLIKHNDDMILNMEVQNNELNKKKIIEHVQIVEKKTQYCLKKHQSVINKMQLQANSVIYGISEAVSGKLIEYNEQMETFKHYSNLTINKIRNLNVSSKNLGEELSELLGDFIKECNFISSALPIYAKKNLILQKIEKHQIIIIHAETGSGKSTQLTQYFLREKNLFKKGRIICTQPRKIAAISLVKHVSCQIGTKVGDIVGYQVGMSSKLSANTRILYVTDFTMLKMLVKEDLNNISCIIIDEAHERTIYTDIILGMLKKDLPLYPHLKVIITSATIDTYVFQDYFNLAEDAVLHIPGTTFPVEDIWLHQDMTSTCDYFTKALDQAFEILSEEPGDILCFLTTPLETERALHSFDERLKIKEYKNVKVLNLHDKLHPDEQQKVFEKTPIGVRKVIFTTNYAETSITIPGIKYVIDCGIIKESKYDAIQNITILSVGFVSKSSIEQRRGRAGRTQYGKCYHLYSKSNYDNMVYYHDPEILRINMGQALMRLMKMGIRDPTQFDFIQSPPKALLNLAMEQLLHLKAVDENTQLLTDLGTKMALLPLEPRLCHLILHGFNNNIGYDVIAISALLTMSSNIFYRSNEVKDEVDKKIWQFCDSKNDFLTYLKVYKEWMDIPKKLKSQWCTTNYINYHCMKIVQELINEIVLILQKELNYKIKMKYEASQETLSKVIFHSFSQNLSIFSGHLKFGYKSGNISESLIIHPSSALCIYEQSTPQFLVYDTIYKTAQNFIVNVCPVTKHMILDAITQYGIKIDLKALEDLISANFCFGPLGRNLIINQFIGKNGISKKYILDKIKKLIGSKLVEMDIDIANGVVKVFAYGNKTKDIPFIICPVIYSAKQKLVNEVKDICLLENSSPLTAVLMAGGSIKDVILPDEFRDVKVILTGTDPIDSVVRKLLVFGSINKVCNFKNHFKVTFDIPASAKKALESSSNEINFSVENIHSNISYDKQYYYKVFITFLRRICTGIAYVTTEPKMKIPFQNRTVLYRGQICQVTLNKTNDIYIKNLPPDTERKDLEPLIASSLLEPEQKIIKCEVIKYKKYNSSKEELITIRNSILQLFSEFTYNENIEVELKSPESKDFIWSAVVYFKNSFDGETAVTILKSRKFISNFAGGIILKPVLQTHLCCKSEIFSAVKDKIEKTLQVFKRDLSPCSLLDINAVPKEKGKVEIKIMSNNIRDIIDVQKCISTILTGDEVTFCKDLDKEKIFTEAGKKLLKTLSTDLKDCYISQNIYNKTLSIFGKDYVCNDIKQEINCFLKMQKNEEYQDVSLKTNSGKSILKELFKLYGHDLSKLKEEFNLTVVQINKFKHILTIQGKSISKCVGVIQELKESNHLNITSDTEEICPICCEELSQEKHRLEYCGHAYCKECLLHLFHNSDIPLKCIFNSGNSACNAVIVLEDFFWVLNEKKPLGETLLNKIFHSFIESRDDISNCPSVDCPMIFRNTENKMNIFRCPACGNDICTRCKEIYHVGITCSLNQCLKSNTKDTFMAWMNDDVLNRKLCPSCSAPIEKNGGCIYMICWKCKCHMCWLCLQVFPSSNLVYDHQIHCPAKNV